MSLPQEVDEVGDAVEGESEQEAEVAAEVSHHLDKVKRGAVLVQKVTLVHVYHSLERRETIVFLEMDIGTDTELATA